MKIKQKLSGKLKYHAASAIVLFLSQFISAIVLAKMLSPSEFSVLGEFLIYTAIALPVISFMSQGYYGKMISQNIDHADVKSANNTLSFSIFLLFAVFGYFYGLGFSFLMAVFVSFVRYFITVKRMVSLISESHKDFAVMTAIPSLLSLAITLLIFTVIETTIENRLIAIFAGELIVFASFARKERFRVDFQKGKELLVYGLPLVLSTIPMWFVVQADKISAQYFFDRKVLYIITAAGVISGALVQFNQFFISYNSPRVYSSYAKGEYTVSRLILDTLLLFIFTLIIVLTMYGLINVFPEYFLSKELEELIPTISIFFIPVVILNSYRFSAICVEASGRTKYKLISSILATLISLLVVIIFYSIGYSEPVLSPFWVSLTASITFSVSMVFFATRLITLKNNQSKKSGTL